ncbi:MAG: competence/damage-inducible protein A [Clostridia bacterium]|nr:competence/damage-inducible protein A [Clostridia bacterium]
MNAEILTVGTELLLGDILNSNSQFLSREMAVYGIDILYQSTVGDNAERLKSALELALSRCNMVILTGGLGPTEDDLTREAVAAYFNVPLELHEESERRIREYFANTGREYTENNQKQAMLPQGCEVFQNDHGTAPGCAIEKYGQTVILLPGPPRELVPMFTEYVVPYLSRRCDSTIHSHTIGVFGIAESMVDERLHDLLQSENPTVAPYAKDGEVVLRVTAKAETVEEADALCAPIIDEIRERLGVAVYGVDAGNLQKTVVSLLKEKGLKIATAESCTAGMLSGRLTEVSGVSEVFECGVAAYSKEIKHQVLGVPESVLKEKGAVSPETAAAMAMGARRVGEADIGVGITGVAGPERSEDKDVGTVYVALADDRRVWVKKVFTGHGEGDREHIRYVATSHALDMARRYLEAYPGVMAGGQLIDKLYPSSPVGFSSRAKRAFLLGVLALVVCVALLLAYLYGIRPRLNQKKFDKLWQVYSQEILDTEEDNAFEYPDGILTRFMSLYRANSDVRGWVTIKGTGINYPVMQEPEQDYYRNRDFYRASSQFGVPYVEKDVTMTVGTDNRSLVIYGNNPASGQMFADLANYTNLGYLRSHATIEWNTLYRQDVYKIFAVMVVGDAEHYTDNFDYTVDTFENEDAFLDYVAQIRQRSLFNTPVGVSEGDDLLMLTTPIEYGFDGARVVVVARRTRTDESSENDLSRARINATVLMPLAWQLQQGDVTAATVTTTTTETTAESTTESTTETTLTTETTSMSASSESTTVQETTATGATVDTSTTGMTTTTTTVSTTATVTTEATTTTVTTTTTIQTTTATTTGESSTAGTDGTSTSDSTTVQTGDRVTTGESTTTTSSTGTTVPVTPPDGSLVSGTYAEADYLSLFKIKNTNSKVKLPGQDENGIIAPTTKEQLQYALASVVKLEMGTGLSMSKSVEAQKAQAVASYSHILYSCAGGGAYEVDCKNIDLTNKTDKKIFDAVGEVLGVKIVNTKASSLKGGLLNTQYSAATGGNTSSSDKVWGGYLAHEVSVPSPHDNYLMVCKYGTSALIEKYISTVVFTREELYEKIKDWVGDKGTIPEELFAELDGKLPLYAVSYDGDGTAGQGDAWNAVYHTNFYYLNNDGKKVVITGHRMRSALGLRSHAFRTSYDAATGKITITTQGHGHGVGLSQMGAIGFANEDGWDYLQILKHYYSVTASSEHQVVAPKW